MRSENKHVSKPAVFLRNTIPHEGWKTHVYTLKCAAELLLHVTELKGSQATNCFNYLKKNKEERVYTKPKPPTAAGLFLQSYSVVINPVMGSCPLNCGAERLMTLTF